MADLTPKLAQARRMADAGEYFTIHRARQYGKTTFLRALAEDLKGDYQVVSLDFQRMSHFDFETESGFVHALAREHRCTQNQMAQKMMRLRRQLKLFLEQEGVCL